MTVLQMYPNEVGSAGRPLAEAADAVHVARRRLGGVGDAGMPAPAAAAFAALVTRMCDRLATSGHCPDETASAVRSTATLAVDTDAAQAAGLRREP